MGLKSSEILKSILAATVLALGLLISGLVPINLSFVKSTIEQHVRENLDLDVTFQGPLRLRLGPKPRVDGAAIEIRKLGAANEVLARVDAVSLSPHLIEILRGRIHVESLHIAGVEFDYCAELPALGNDETSAKPLPSIAANDLTVTNLQLYCGTPGDEQKLKVVVEELLEVISETLEKDNSIEIRGFGTFYTKIRKPRPARNIKTGETVPLKERVVPLFRYSADLKGKIDRANKGGPIESIFIEV